MLDCEPQLRLRDAAGATVDVPLAYNVAQRTATPWESDRAAADDTGSLSTRDILLRMAKVRSAAGGRTRSVEQPAHQPPCRVG